MFKNPHAKNIVAELSKETGVSAEDIHKIVTHLGLGHALEYAHPAGTKSHGLQISILSGRYTVDV